MLITRGLGKSPRVGEPTGESVYVYVSDPKVAANNLGVSTFAGSMIKPAVSIKSSSLVPTAVLKADTIKTTIDITSLRPSIQVKKD